MKMSEIFKQWYEVIGEDADAVAQSAERNMKAARGQKKQAQILKTKDALVDQQKQLNDIKKAGGII